MMKCPPNATLTGETNASDINQLILTGRSQATTEHIRNWLDSHYREDANYTGSIHARHAAAIKDNRDTLRP